MIHKEIYLIRGSIDETYVSFREKILAKANEVNNLIHPLKIRVTLTENPPPVISVIPFRKGRIAAFSILREAAGSVPLSPLIEMAGFSFACRVEEAIPVAYAKDWPDGSVTPGICLLTLFRQRKDIGYDKFIDRWHNSHTPLSLRIHPLWHYNRNVVTETLSANESPWGGIVEEHFNPASNLLNPFKFFGNPLVIIPRMIEVYRDTNRFLDYKTIEPWLVREYHIKQKYSARINP
jgi:hypothetical protein